MEKNMFYFLSLLGFFWQLIIVDAEINYVNYGCVDSGDYTKTSQYPNNLDNLFSNLSTQTLTQKFYNSTIGDDPDIVYGLYQCREDVTLEICSECIQDATKMIVEKCPLYKEAIVWYEECMLRYSNRSSIFSSMETFPSYIRWGKRNVSNYDDLAPVLASKLKSVISEAAVSTNLGHFATEEGNWTLLDSVYCLAQCTPDIDEFHCRNCLTRASSLMISAHNTSVRVMMLYPSCQLRYDTTQRFYQVIGNPAPAPALSNKVIDMDKGRSKKFSSIAILSLGILVVILIILVTVLMYLQCKKRSKNNKDEDMINYDGTNEAQKFENVGEDFMIAESLHYDFATLKFATNNFSDFNKLGEGGFGCVYKGTLPNGQEVAVKRLSKSSNQGVEQFKNEAVFVAKLQHRNLVRLLGFCLTQDEMLLVYEFVINKSLDLILFDPETQGRLDWSVRYKIIHGIARGILYIHEDSRVKIIHGIARGILYIHEDSRVKIIHRDLKASNILLDADMNPKISDFGLARNFAVNQKQDQTNRLAGTLGYMAPEYIEYGEISAKSDVYSFGVLVLEIMSGKKISHRHSTAAENLLLYVWRHWSEGTPLEVVDASLENSYSTSEVIRCLHLGLLCVQGDVDERPSMLSIVFYLNSNVDLPTPQQPAFMISRRKGLSSGGRELNGKFARTESRSSTNEQRSDETTSQSVQSFSGIDIPR